MVGLGGLGVRLAGPIARARSVERGTIFLSWWMHCLAGLLHPDFIQLYNSIKRLNTLNQFQAIAVSVVCVCLSQCAALMLQSLQSV